MKKVRKTPRPFRCDLDKLPYNYTGEVTNRFKELDLVERVPEELQKMVPKIIPKKKKCQKAEWLSEEVLLIAEK